MFRCRRSRRRCSRSTGSGPELEAQIDRVSGSGVAARALPINHFPPTTDALHERFHQDGHRVVFWHDPERVWTWPAASVKAAYSVPSA